jgi:hypothetical protein
MPKRLRRETDFVLAPGEWIPGKQRYRIERFVGRGSFAAAYQARTEVGEICFVKEYLPPSRPGARAEIQRMYATERDVVRRIGQYELIPRFWDAFTHAGYHYLITDFVPGEDLETVLRSGNRPSVEVLVRWSVCLCHELAYLHSRNVIHHDLKPGNVRLNEDGDPVIVDFSAAHWYRLPGETTEFLYGSDSYLAPEHTERSAEDADSGKQMDVFAMGRILVELMVGERLSQEDINRRQDQIYGQILHSGKLDVAFVRAVLRSVAYNLEQRYRDGVQLVEDITPAAPPVGRVRPRRLDFGTTGSTEPLERQLQAYNVGGGKLTGEVAVEGDWLEIGTTGATTGPNAMFERNRQSVRVVARPERVAAGTTATGRIVFTFPNDTAEVSTSLERLGAASEVQHQPAALKINVAAGGFGSGQLTFSNRGDGPARVQLQSPADLLMSVQPEEFVLAPGARQEVIVSLDASILGDRTVETALRWQVDSNPRPTIAVRASVGRGSGFFGALAGRLRKS